MNPIQTGIAVALALVVVIGVFVFGFPLFNNTGATTNSSEATTTTMGTSTNPTDATTATGAPAAEPTAEQLAAQEAKLNAVTELQMQDITVGTGAVAAAGDTVTVNYVGALTNGKVFDASANHGSDGFTFPLGAGQVIQGWDKGVAGMKEGGKRVLIIPASMGYGAAGAGSSIPPNAVLVFQVELVKVVKK